MTNYSALSWHIENEIGHLMINRPPANKMDRQFFHELRSLVTQIIPESMAKGILVYGNGRHFSSGADLEDLLIHTTNASDNGNTEFFMENLESFRFFQKSTIPTIGVINGVCIGSGFELALSCHYRICSINALMGLPEISFNLLPGCGGIQNLTQIVGKAKAMELILSGRNLIAIEAKELGIVNLVVDKKEMLQKAIQFINKIK
jgi:enoyl-CoA hydratase/carnithine racemase